MVFFGGRAPDRDLRLPGDSHVALPELGESARVHPEYVAGVLASISILKRDLGFADISYRTFELGNLSPDVLGLSYPEPPNPWRAIRLNPLLQACSSRELRIPSRPTKRLFRLYGTIQHGPVGVSSIRKLARGFKIL